MSDAIDHLMQPRFQRHDANDQFREIPEHAFSRPPMESPV